MRAITFANRNKGGEPVKTLAIPLNRSEEARLTRLDGMVIGIILLLTAVLSSAILLSLI